MQEGFFFRHLGAILRKLIKLISLHHKVIKVDSSSASIISILLAFKTLQLPYIIILKIRDN